MALGKQARIDRKHQRQVAAANGQGFRQYVAGETPPGAFPGDLDGQVEILKVQTINPKAIVMR